ncbi:lupus La protein [Spea bombifrons]|uniref:lupus La protein n=1 Tax=Spea bombifrons TaxID=233779 RepID=UPI0023498070|nr:lupus La protein [Spea bombifrons]
MAENGEKEQMSALETKICQQIEFYFGDHNLPRDKFLKDQIALDDGWVPLKTMITFNRLSKLTTDFSTIFGALKKSKTGLLELDEDNCKIRRSLDNPIPEATEEYKNLIKKRTVYIKGFPVDTTLDDIKEWLESNSSIESIQMRRTLERAFKGSIFIVFDSEESAKKFLENRDLKYKDTDMIILSKDEYYMKKNDERKQNKSDAKAKQEQEEAERNSGCLLKFSGDLDNMTSREDLTALFQNHGEIKWIDFSRGANEGIILFKEKAKEALEKAKAANNDSLKLKDKDVKWELLEGEVEQKALKKLIEDQQECYNKKKGKGGRKFKGKGRGGRGNDNSPKKKIQFQGQKKKFDSSDEGDMEDTDSHQKGTDQTDVTEQKNGSQAAGSPKKRALEDNVSEEPLPKQAKTEEAGDH